MALPKVPISVQLSPSAYILLMKMIELGLEPDPADPDKLRFRQVQRLQDAVENLFNELIATSSPPLATVDEFKKLQQDSLEEANQINKQAGSQVTMTC